MISRESRDAALCVFCVCVFLSLLLFPHTYAFRSRLPKNFGQAWLETDPVPEHWWNFHCVEKVTK